MSEQELRIWNVSIIGGEVITDSAVNPPTVHVELGYPGVPPKPGEVRARHVQVGLMGVRAADDIRISYDKERDGWSIEQASMFSWPADDPICDEDWQEVAFVKAWAREEEATPNE